MGTFYTHPEQLDFCDVTIVPTDISSINSRNEPSLQRRFVFKHSGLHLSCVPIIAANMLTGSFAMADALAEQEMITVLHKHHSIEAYGNFFNNRTFDKLQYVFYTLGLSDLEAIKYKKVADLIGYRPPMVCIDVANGYMAKFRDYVARFRDENPRAVIMAGNVVTGEAVEQLLESGADIVKIGIGSGQNCLTRRVTGVGRPQLSAVLECADAADLNGGLICSDGGCSEGGDVAIAFGAGADFVMLGTMLAGSDETEGTTYYLDGKPFKEFFGMSSNTAMARFGNGRPSYKASEGRTTLVPGTGPVSNTLEEICGGVRGAMSMIGAREMHEVSEKTKFIRVRRRLNTTMERYTTGN
jgi:GMP reductase